MKNRKFAYVRGSSRDQNVARQMDTMRNLGIEERNILVDNVTNGETDRIEYQSLKRMLREGDILYIHTLDLLGKTKELIAEEWHDITIRIKADLVVLDRPPLDTTKKYTAEHLISIMLSWMAEEERLKLAQIRAEKIHAAKERGAKFGRKRAELTPKFLKAYQQWKSKEITASQAIEESGVARSTFYKLVREKEKEKED